MANLHGLFSFCFGFFVYSSVSVYLSSGLLFAPLSSLVQNLE